MVIKRDYYLNQIIGGMGNGLIKIITGLRRCGKSYLLFNLFADYLLTQGVEKKHIIKINLEDLRNESLRNPFKLLEYIDSNIKDGSMYYILLDEVQHVARFEDVLNSYLSVDNVDIYVTGSNSKFLSSDIITEFRGRGDQIHVYPLSFAEYITADTRDISIAWRDYITYGGLPHAALLSDNHKKGVYLENIFQTVYKKDMEERYKIVKSREFDELIQTMASTIGSPCNPNKLSNTFKTNNNSTLSSATVATYLEYLQEAYLIEKAERYDVKGRKYIGSLSKYYFTDIGIRNAILNFRQQEETHIMENIIYNELLIRGFTVDVGTVPHRYKENDSWKRTEFEIDFVAQKADNKIYIQSAFAIPDSDKMAQESSSLRHVNDSFRKIIIVKDNINPWMNEDGIQIIGLFDFLLNPNSI